MDNVSSNEDCGSSSAKKIKLDNPKPPSPPQHPQCPVPMSQQCPFSKKLVDPVEMDSSQMSVSNEPKRENISDVESINSKTGSVDVVNEGNGKDGDTSCDKKDIQDTEEEFDDDFDESEQESDYEFIDDMLEKGVQPIDEQTTSNETNTASTNESNQLPSFQSKSRHVLLSTLIFFLRFRCFILFSYRKRSGSFRDSS